MTSPEDFYATLNPDWLLCRAYGHAWEPYTAELLMGTYDVTVKCARCGTLKRDTLTSSGKPVGHSVFNYAPGYQNSGAGRTLVGTRGVAKMVAVKAQQPQLEQG